MTRLGFVADLLEDVSVLGCDLLGNRQLGLALVLSVDGLELGLFETKEK